MRRSSPVENSLPMPHSGGSIDNHSSPTRSRVCVPPEITVIGVRDSSCTFGCNDSPTTPGTGNVSDNERPLDATGIAGGLDGRTKLVSFTPANAQPQSFSGCYLSPHQQQRAMPMARLPQRCGWNSSQSTVHSSRVLSPMSYAASGSNWGADHNDHAGGGEEEEDNTCSGLSSRVDNGAPNTGVTGMNMTFANFIRDSSEHSSSCNGPPRNSIGTNSVDMAGRPSNNCWVTNVRKNGQGGGGAGAASIGQPTPLLHTGSGDGTLEASSLRCVELDSSPPSGLPPEPEDTEPLSAVHPIYLENKGAMSSFMSLSTLAHTANQTHSHATIIAGGGGAGGLHTVNGSRHSSMSFGGFLPSPSFKTGDGFHTPSFARFASSHEFTPPELLLNVETAAPHPQEQTFLHKSPPTDDMVTFPTQPPLDDCNPLMLPRGGGFAVVDSLSRSWRSMARDKPDVVISVNASPLLPLESEAMSHSTSPPSPPSNVERTFSSSVASHTHYQVNSQEELQLEELRGRTVTEIEEALNMEKLRGAEVGAYLVLAKALREEYHQQRSRHVSLTHCPGTTNNEEVGGSSDVDEILAIKNFCAAREQKLVQDHVNDMYIIARDNSKTSRLMLSTGSGGIDGSDQSRDGAEGARALRGRAPRTACETELALQIEATRRLHETSGGSGKYFPDF